VPCLLVFAPFCIKWLAKPTFERTRGQYIELAFAEASVAAVALLLFVGPSDNNYLLFVPLMWVTLRTGPRGTTLALAMSGAVALWATAATVGAAGLFPTELFLSTAAGLSLLFCSVIEERKESERELNRHVEELEQALHKISTEDEAKKNFLAVLAHELRNPLAAMLSSIELLRLKSTDVVESSLLLQTVGEHVHAMRSMLDDVLDISRISRNKLTLRKEVVPLDAIVDRSAKSVESLMRNRRHRLLITKTPKPLYVSVDPIRMEQIVVNLLNNAAKYTNPGGLIQLTLREENGQAVASLKDNGVGISRTMLKPIFEPFFQVQRGKLATEGLGVGLPLTRQLVEMHGGTIEAKSEGSGKGSEFFVRLPLARKKETKAEKPSTLPGRSLRSVRNKRAILVVDDNETAARALGRLLELRGHSVSIVYNGLDAVERAREAQPDIIVLDIGLPDIDGYEVTRILRGDPNFPSAIIALTGYGQEEDKQRALESGFNWHLTKPVGLRELERVFTKVAR
jgi:signal transduction histidine kinase/CheY-like chemotaxis protein